MTDRSNEAGGLKAEAFGKEAFNELKAAIRADMKEEFQESLESGWTHDDENSRVALWKAVEVMEELQAIKRLRRGGDYYAEHWIDAAEASAREVEVGKIILGYRKDWESGDPERIMPAATFESWMRKYCGWLDAGGTMDEFKRMVSDSVPPIKEINPRRD